MNSFLITITFKLKRQGIIVKFENVEVTTEDMYDNIFDDFKEVTNKFIIQLMKDSELPQKSRQEFTDYHNFHFRAC